MTHDILTYLAENPEAQDTFEGIVEWWLLEQKIERQTLAVRQALEELAAQKLIIARRTKDLRTHYRINRRKAKDIRALLARTSL
ncbi:MAG TPA: hypothetical protein VF525_12945 [Pyrinomonadaceae bacterium]|jgi:hypothetical protein